MSIYHTISTNDGETLKLTLNFGAVYALSKKNKELADEYFEMQRNLQKNADKANELDMAKFVYIAYRCAHIDDEDVMNLEEFLYKLTESREELSNTFRDLYGAKKKQGSPMPSGGPRKKNRRG